MEPPEYTNCLTLPASSEGDPALACKPDPKDDDHYSNIYQDIYQDVLVPGAEEGNRRNSFQEPRNETASKAKKEVRAGIFARGRSGYRNRAKKLVTRFWPLLVLLLLMWFLLLTVMLVKYREISNKMMTDHLEHSAMIANNKELLNKMMTAKLEHSVMIANISSGLRNAEINREETKARLETDLAELRAHMEAYYRCPVGWKKHKFHCYYFSSTEQTWEAARSTCSAQNSNLVIVNTQQEQNFLVQNLNSQLHWIGLSDSATEGTWLWVSGEPLILSFWRQGEPNNAHSSITGEDCAAIEPSNSWNDVSCSITSRWICEKGLL